MATKIDSEGGNAFAQKMEEQNVRKWKTLLENGAAFALRKNENVAHRHLDHGHKPNRSQPQNVVYDGSYTFDKVYLEAVQSNPKTDVRHE